MTPSAWSPRRAHLVRCGQTAREGKPTTRAKFESTDPHKSGHSRVVCDGTILTPLHTRAVLGHHDIHTAACKRTKAVCLGHGRRF